MTQSRVLLVVVAVCALLAIGCSDSKLAKVVPVEGTIKFADGKPLPTGTRLLFNPSVGNMGSASGVTDETGAFKVVHQSGKTGAGVGKYTVQIAAPEGKGADFYKLVPRTYFDNGGLLTLEVVEGMATVNFVVKK